MHETLVTHMRPTPNQLGPMMLEQMFISALQAPSLSASQTSSYIGVWRVHCDGLYESNRNVLECTHISEPTALITTLSFKRKNGRASSGIMKGGRLYFAPVCEKGH